MAREMERLMYGVCERERTYGVRERAMFDVCERGRCMA
jgi:hypothetical protein